MQPAFLMHKHGGRITALTSIAHDTEDGVASWHFYGSVDWSDGSKSKEIIIPPWALCCDHKNPDAVAEVNTALQKLNDYLAEVGTWHEKTKWVRGHAVSWTPKQKTGSRSL